jgi:hypothetical protein
MSDIARDTQISYPDLIDDRYRVEKVLGKGGMAIVYHVVDIKTGREEALKQLSVKQDTHNLKEVAELFEHEFHILAQLAHPRVIEVYDFGKNVIGPYYTMELLDGGDIRELAPLPWKRVCSLFIDVCSALSLIHSRRQLHRDLTPSNVRCTRDGKAKLIDFGAMTPMGPCKQLIGTPPFTPPEVVGLQSIDARSDLYALGATIYYALTARTAYRAGSFQELRDAWRSRPLPPSAIVEDIPRELDDLVRSLINLDALARPINAAEVMEKLSAIAGMEIDNTLTVSQAYLSKPMLVGRNDQVVPVRRQMMQAINGTGTTFFIDGASGVGRSRFLDACVLEGRVVGATVLRADASDSYAGAWGAVKTLAAQLTDALPEIALEEAKPHIALLGQILPDLVRKLDAFKAATPGTLPPASLAATRSVPGSTFDHSAEIWSRGYSTRPPPPDERSSIPVRASRAPQELRPRIQTALIDWWLKVAEQRCLVVAVDDIHRMDEPSAACIALLSRRLSGVMMLLAVTAESDAPEGAPVAMKMLRLTDSVIHLGDLKLENTEKLMSSIFGETAHLKLVASRIQEISCGNPRAVMQLLQHLVDTGIIRYQTGAWALPGAIDAADLPASVNEALTAKARQLRAEALHLAQTIALDPDQRFSYDECQLLSGRCETGRLIRDLDELVAAEILSTDGLNYWLSQQGWAPILVDTTDEADKNALHLRMAEMFEKRGNDQFRVGQHLLSGGQSERALDVFIRFSEASRALTDKSPQAFSGLIQSLPKNWFETYQTAIGICETIGKPLASVYALRTRLSGLTAVTGNNDNTSLIRLIEQLSSESGVSSYYELGDSVDPQARLARAFEIAQQKYDTRSASERVLSPFEAIRELAKVLIQAIGQISTTYDFGLWQTLPSLKPYGALSPTLQVVDNLVQAIGHRIVSRCERACQAYREILERTAQPDRAGLEETHHMYLRFGVMRGVGMMEAAMGLSSALEWAQQIEIDPTHQVNAWRIRMLFYTWQGAASGADECKQRIERLQIENTPTQWFEGSHLGQEVFAYALSDDLTGIKQNLDDIKQVASAFSGWKSTLAYARGEYQRIRGDYHRALEELKGALEQTAPGRNHDWPYIASAYLRTLNALGQYEQTVVEGRRLIEAAKAQSLNFVVNYLQMPLAEAEARQGLGAEAVISADAVIASFNGFGTTGLSLGLAYETRAHVGALLKDDEAFERNAKLCAAQYQAGHNRALVAKYQKLMQEARGAMMEISAELACAADFTQMSMIAAQTQMATLLEGCSGPKERAARSLALLIKLANCTGGFLYIMKEQGPELSATDSQQAPPPEMETLVQDRLNEEIAGEEDITQEGDDDDDDEQDDESSLADTTDWATQMGDEYRSVLLGHNTSQGFAITGMAILVTNPRNEYIFPAETVEKVSRSLYDSGDAAKVYASE